MRQTLFMLAIVIGSPLAMAEDPVGAATSSVIGADASRQPAAAALVAAPRAASQEDHAKAAPKPVSAIGRALAELMQDAKRQPSKAKPHHADTTAAAGTSREDDAARPTQLVAKDEPDGGS